MALKFLVAETAPPQVAEQTHKVLVEEALSEVEALTLEYVKLFQTYTAFEMKETISRMEDIRKQLQSIANEEVEANKPAIFKCATGEVEFGPRQKKSEVPDPLGLIQVLLAKFGPEATQTAVDIAITPLKKLLSEHELKDHLQEVPGPRIVKAVRVKE
jgi:hypothetical protein